MTDFIGHLEAYLGRVQKRFEPARDEDRRPFQVLSFDGMPFRESTTIVTAGLGAHVLDQPKGPAVRQELVGCAYRAEADERFAGLVDLVGRDMLQSHKAVLRGQVIGPGGPLVRGATVEALLCASPWYWPEGFERYDGMQPPVLIIWLVPITASEAAFVRERGIDAFEELVEKHEPDLLDLQRSPIA